MIYKLHERTKWGFAKVGLDIVSIGSCKHPNFSTGLTSNIGLSVLNLSTYFQFGSGYGFDGILN